METHFVGLCTVVNHSGNGSRPIPFRAHLIDSQTKSAINSRLKRTIKLHPYQCNYNECVSALKEKFPVLNEENFILTWKGEYGKKKQIFNQDDFSTMLNEMGTDRSLYALFNYDLDSYFSSDSSDMPHVQFLCDVCCYPLKHFRYRCQVCRDYNVCMLCLHKGFHQQHKLKYMSITRAAFTNMKIEEIDFKNLKIKDEIGKGYYSKVHLAEAKNRIARQKFVAVKILKERATTHVDDDFEKEMNIFENLGYHENVVKIFGYCTEPYAIVMEYVSMKISGMEINSLLLYLKYLRRKMDPQNTGSLDLLRIDHRELESFALQIARGMEYLESRDIVHRDLAARNVLIDSTKTLKITDFGLARTGEYQGPQQVITTRYASPEVLTSRSYSNKSDVWSFAIVCWEIATLGATPYPELTCFREIENFVVKGGRLKKPINVSSELFSIMTKCWAQRPQKRPNFRQLVEKLNDFKWMDCAYIPLHSINCVYILQPATDEYETRMEELWQNAKASAIKQNGNVVEGEKRRKNRRR